MLPYPPRLRSSMLLRDVDGIERSVARQTVIDAAVGLLDEHMRSSPVLLTPQRAMDYVQLKLGTLEHEVFGLIHLDKRYIVIDYVEMFRGTVDRVTVHPRELAKDVMTLNSTTVILVHNHPLC